MAGRVESAWQRYRAGAPPLTTSGLRIWVPLHIPKWTPSPSTPSGSLYASPTHSPLLSSELREGRHGHHGQTSREQCHSRRHSLFTSLQLYNKPRPPCRQPRRRWSAAAQAGPKPDVSSLRVSSLKRRSQGPRVRI